MRNQGSHVHSRNSQESVAFAGCCSVRWPVILVGRSRSTWRGGGSPKGGRLVHLTQTEFALLRQFAVSPGVLLTHATLLRRVWGPGYETQTEYTRVYVARLRAKLESPGGEQLFITEPRSGYRFALPAQDRMPLAASRGPG